MYVKSNNVILLDSTLSTNFIFLPFILTILSFLSFWIGNDKFTHDNNFVTFTSDSQHIKNTIPPQKKKKR